MSKDPTKPDYSISAKQRKLEGQTGDRRGLFRRMMRCWMGIRRRLMFLTLGGMVPSLFMSGMSSIEGFGWLATLALVWMSLTMVLLAYTLWSGVRSMRTDV
jgi:hypothetical protein